MAGKLAEKWAALLVDPMVAQTVAHLVGSMPAWTAL